MRRPKRFLPVFLLFVLLVVCFSMSGCKPGKEKEAVDLLNTMFPESTATPTPSPAPTPTPEPTPTEEPTPEKKIGMHMTNEFWEKLAGLWPVKNKPISDFGEPYKVYGDYDVQADSTKLIYAFYPAMTEEEARTYYGQLIFGLDLTESYHECKFVGETNAQGDPLDVAFQIVPYGNSLEVYLTFDSEETKTFIDQVLEAYWPEEPALSDVVYGVAPMFRGFVYDSQGEDIFGLYHISDANSEKIAAIREELSRAYGALPDFIEDQNPKTNTPRCSFTLDINQDGDSRLPIFACPIFVDFYEDSRMVKFAIGMD